MGEPVLFYNLLVHIIANDKLIEETAALKNIWGKDGNIMLNLYFYRTKTSKVIDSAYIHDIMDLSTEKYYTRCQDLLKDYETQVVAAKPEKVRKTELPDFRHMECLKDDLIILIFVSRCIDYYSEIKKRTIFQYIKTHHPQPQNLSEQYIETYLNGVKPTLEEFYKALDNLKAKMPEEAADLAKEVVKICISDGTMAYNEKVYIAEILQILREQGVEPDVGL